MSNSQDLSQSSSPLLPRHSSQSTPSHSGHSSPHHLNQFSSQHSSQPLPIHSSQSRPQHSSQPLLIHSSQSTPQHSIWICPPPSHAEHHGAAGSIRVGARDCEGHLLSLHGCCRTGRGSFTSAIPQNSGVKQRCPLRTILFNIVLESQLKHLTTNKAGYTLAEDSYNSLAYADDVCVAASTKEGLQSLLDQCKEFADWAGLTFNVKKCGSLCLVNESHHVYVDHLFTSHLGTEVIPALS